jgi:hypothetical protein
VKKTRVKFDSKIIRMIECRCFCWCCWVSSQWLQRCLMSFFIPLLILSCLCDNNVVDYWFNFSFSLVRISPIRHRSKQTRRKSREIISFGDASTREKKKASVIKELMSRYKPNKIEDMIMIIENVIKICDRENHFSKNFMP